jgi:hypothetical protein
MICPKNKLMNICISYARFFFSSPFASTCYTTQYKFETFPNNTCTMFFWESQAEKC